MAAGIFRVIANRCLNKFAQVDEERLLVSASSDFYRHTLRGDTYTASQDAVIGSGAFLRHGIITPVNYDIGATISFSTSTAQISIVLRENDTWTGFSAITSFNRNRSSSKTDMIGRTGTLTGITVAGTTLMNSYKNANAAGWENMFSANGSDIPWVLLKRDTQYYLQIVNQGAGTNRIQIHFDYMVFRGTV